MKIEKRVVRLVEKKRLSEDYWWFELEFIKEFNFKAGQYVSVKVNETGERRAYSIASVPGGKKIGLLVDVSPGGVGSKFFENLKLGDGVEVLGPLGRFVVNKKGYTFDGFHLGGVRVGTQPPSEEKSLIFVGTGSGIAPLRSMIEDVLQSKVNDRSVYLVWGMRFEKDLFWQKEFEELERKYKNFKFELTLSKPSENWKGKKGRVTEVLKEMKRLEDVEFYLCGSSVMVEDCVKILTDKGVDEEKIQFEKYG
ncbi:hypothetical protein KJ953_00665 [Patescibacteria group bacterium]|nr:hypothetical protein [Patescibacteria group bacterium]MBU1256575.1 hypothetical protein [Patescibacteria group bacterium]MBU1457625.1 hypothetical protein [Patescibacteria group bacterium]